MSENIDCNDFAGIVDFLFFISKLQFNFDNQRKSMIIDVRNPVIFLNDSSRFWNPRSDLFILHDMCSIVIYFFVSTSRKLSSRRRVTTLPFWTFRWSFLDELTVPWYLWILQIKIRFSFIFAYVRDLCARYIFECLKNNRFSQGDMKCRTLYRFVVASVVFSKSIINISESISFRASDRQSIYVSRLVDFDLLSIIWSTDNFDRRSGLYSSVVTPVRSVDVPPSCVSIT